MDAERDGEEEEEGKKDAEGRRRADGMVHRADNYLYLNNAVAA
jgi:hypothetical protein